MNTTDCAVAALYERRLLNDRGVSLIETMIAVLIALIAVFGLGGLVFQATAVNKNQGSETTRSVIYAQDKMEKLLSLAAYNSITPFNTTNGCPTSVPSGFPNPNFCDCNLALSTPQPSFCNTTNISDAGWTTGLVAGGGTTLTWDPTIQSWKNFACGDISTPGYVDYLDNNGVQLPQAGTPPVPAPGACTALPMNKVAYLRMWQITDVTTPGTGPAVKQITLAVYSLGALAGAGGRPIVILTSYIENPN